MTPKQTEFEKETTRERAARYSPSQGLKDAAQVAIDLGMPLLLTGAPGTGKTDLAHFLAYKRNESEALVFHTKSTSVYTDLFYQYDALGHFRAGQGASIGTYITIQALGTAIQRAERREGRSVVLVDEIDKAPRDLPNDILNEIENMEFQIKETNASHKADPEFQPILVFTSNKEKDLPDAFLRRCVFFYIDFKDVPLDEIIRTRFKLDERPDAAVLAANALVHFKNIREIGLDKIPATAELIKWIDYLIRRNVDVTARDPKTVDLLAISYSLLAKNDDDLKKLKKSR